MRSEVRIQCSQTENVLPKTRSREGNKRDKGGDVGILTPNGRSRSKLDKGKKQVSKDVHYILKFHDFPGEIDGQRMR